MSFCALGEEEEGGVTASDRPVVVEVVYSSKVGVFLRFDRDGATMLIVQDERPRADLNEF